jgi:hypothetical protein
MKALPIGIQDFESLRSGGYLYVDKTECFYDVFKHGTYYFLSRPRRFGKSMMLSTLKYLYQGKKDLFKGLWIEDKWNWDKVYPVIYIDINDAVTKGGANLAESLMIIISNQANQHEIELTAKDPGNALRELIHRLGAADSKCVVLIDEYDKPITDYITEPEISEQHVKELKSFYGILKGSDQYLHKVIISGVSKYGKVSISSDLNNLNDISMKADAAKICGYTQEELEYVFKDYFIKASEKFKSPLSEIFAVVKNWYNGYVFDDELTAKLYNPFSILNFFDKYQFKNYWFETGTPTFLTKIISEEKIDPARLEYLKATDIMFKSADIEHIDILSLLYQTGYLSIKDIVGQYDRRRYILGFPNYEVRSSFMTYLLSEYLSESPTLVSSDIIVKIQDALWERDWDSFINVLNHVFATVPYQIFNTNEAYYHSLVHVALTLSGHLVLSEVLTNKGRIDTVLETDDLVVIFEFKMDSSPELALQQIHEKKYAERYAKSAKDLLLIGVNFDSVQRRISNWKLEQ